MMYRGPQGAPGRPRLVKGTEGRLWAIFVGGDRQPQSGVPGLQLQFRIYTVISRQNRPENRDLWCFVGLKTLWRGFLASLSAPG